MTPEVQLLRLPTGSGPEDVAVDPDGHVFAGGDDGMIWRFSGFSGETAQSVADTGGRPLGIEFDPTTGTLIVCDAVRGLLRVGMDGSVRLLARTAGGSAIRFCNNAAVADDGVVYFSDSSSRYSFSEWRDDIREARPNGRLLRHDPRTDATDVLADGLYFPNGVALHPSGDVLVAESTTGRLLRVSPTGVELVVELPSYPDNMAAVGDGTYWIALPGRAPEGGAVLVDAAGTILRRLRIPNFQMITGVRAAGNVLWLGSLREPGIGRTVIA